MNTSTRPALETVPRNCLEQVPSQPGHGAGRAPSRRGAWRAWKAVAREFTRDEQVAVATDQHPAASRGQSSPAAAARQGGDCRLAAGRGSVTARRPLDPGPICMPLQARIRAEQANVGLACKEYYPDLNLVAKYDGFMPENMRPAVGMDVTPAAERAAIGGGFRGGEPGRPSLGRVSGSARPSALRSSIRARSGRAERRVVHLYEEKILPAAQRSLIRRRRATPAASSTFCGSWTPSGNSTRSAKCTTSRSPNIIAAWPSLSGRWASRCASIRDAVLPVHG